MGEASAASISSSRCSATSRRTGGQVLLARVAALHQGALVARDRVVLLPRLDLARRHVLLRVVLGVPLAAIGDDLDQRGALAADRARARRAHRVEHREHVVSIHRHSRQTEPRRLVGDAVHRHLSRGRRRVRVAVVLGHHDQRKLPHRGQVHALIERAGGGRSISDERQRHAILMAKLGRQRDAGHDRNGVAEHAHRRQDTRLGHGAEMRVEILASGRSAGAGHVLHGHVARSIALHQHRAQVADQRSHDVLLLEREDRADRLRLLTQAAVEPAHDLVLAVEVDQPLLQAPREQHPAVEARAALRG